MKLCVFNKFNLNKKSPALCVCVCVSVYLERSAACPGMPDGRARGGRALRARPKGVSLKGPEGATAAAGRQGVRVGGSEG